MTTTELKTQAAFDPAVWTRAAEKRAREAGEPDGALELRRTAAAYAAALPFPGREDELWRRSDFRTLETQVGSLDPFVAPEPIASPEDLTLLRARLGFAETDQAATIVQRNAAVVFERLPAALERQGVVVCSIERAAREHRGRLEPLYGSLIASDYDRWTALGTALRSGGAFVWVPDGVDAALPIRILQTIDRAGTLAAPRTVIALGRGARATVIDEQISETAEAAALHLGGTEVFVGEDAKLVYGTLQDWGRNVYHYSNQRARLARGAELQWIQTLLGGRMVKTNSYFDLAGPGAQAFVHGFMFGDLRQHFNLHTLQRHLVDHCTSDLLIKCCLKDRARSIYQGLIQVSPDAQRTDAYQANRNLLLSNLARADSIPGLEILANDVRCTHGATIGHVDEEQMYYLMSRGLPRPEAQRLIVEGFFAPVLDRIPLESVRDLLRHEIERKLG